MPHHEGKSLKELRKRGLVAEQCSYWFSAQQYDHTDTPGRQSVFRQGGFRKDVAGFLDVLAWGPGVEGVLGVQVTSRKQMTPHIRKYRNDEATREKILQFLASGNQLVIHGWERVEIPTVSKTAKSATVARWQLTERSVTCEDMQPIAKPF